MAKSHIFITGTSKGIGFALVNTLLEQKKDVIIYGFSRNQTISHPSFIHQTTDLSDPSFIESVDFDKATVNKDDTVVLVNNAGVIKPVNRAGHASEKEITDHLNINLMAPVLLINKFFRIFESHIGKKIVINVSSGAARRPIDGWSCYCSGKAGLEMYTKTIGLENEIHNTGFQVFSVSPGIIDTPMQEIIRTSDPKEFTLQNEFVRYKKEKLLKDPLETSKHLIDVIYNTEKYTEILIEF